MYLFTCLGFLNLPTGQHNSSWRHSGGLRSLDFCTPEMKVRKILFAARVHSFAIDCCIFSNLLLCLVVKI